MLLRSLFLKTLRDLRGQVLGWGTGVGLLGLLVVSLYPAFKDQMGAWAGLMASYPEAFTAFFGDMTMMGEWSGWLNVEFFSWTPPILAIFAVATGAGLVAGEEERGTLDLLLSHPIRRWRVVMEKYGAFCLAIALICLLAALFLVVGAVLARETGDLGRLLVAMLDIIPITLASGTFALLTSVVLRSRRLAITMAVVLVIGSWFVDSLGKMVDVLEPLRPFTLYHYFNGGTILRGAGEWSNVFVLLGLCLLFLAGSLFAFQHRDIAV